MRLDAAAAAEQVHRSRRSLHVAWRVSRSGATGCAPPVSTKRDTHRTGSAHRGARSGKQALKRHEIQVPRGVLYARAPPGAARARGAKQVASIASGTEAVRCLQQIGVSCTGKHLARLQGRGRRLSGLLVMRSGPAECSGRPCCRGQRGGDAIQIRSAFRGASAFNAA